MSSNDKIIRMILRMEDQVSVGANSASSAFQKLGSTVSSVGNAMTVGLTAPILAIGALAAKTAIDFESAFAGVAKTVDGTVTELEQLRSELEQLATSAESPVSALENAHLELFAIAEAAGQLGVAREDIVAFSDVMGQLAMSTDVAGEAGAALIARFANVSKMPLSQIREFGDAIVTLGNSSAATEQEILGMSLRLASIAELGFKPDQILAYSSALSSLGITAELGGTNFMKGMNEIAKAVAIGGGELDNFAQVAGMSSQEFAKAWGEDASGAFQKFLEGLSKMDASERIIALEELGLTGSEMQRVFLALAGSTDLVTDSLNKSSEAFAGNGALMDEASKRAETTAGRMNRAKNMFNQVMNDFGEQLIPLIVDFLEKGVIPLLNWINSLDDSTRQWIIGLLAVVAAIGPIVSVIGSLISAFSMISAAMPMVAGAFAAFVAAIASPIGIAIALVAGLFLAWQTNFLGFRDLIMGFVNFFIEAFSIIFNGDYLGKFLEEDHPLIGFLLLIRKLVGPAIEDIKAFVSAIWNAWGGMIGKAGEVFNQLGTIIQSRLSQLGSQMMQIGELIIGGLLNGIKSKAVDLVAYVFGLSKELTAAIKSALGIHSPSKVMMDIGKNVVAGFHEGIESMGGVGVNVPQASGGAVSGQPSLAVAGAGGMGGNTYQTYNVYAAPGSTDAQVRDISEKLAKLSKKKGANGL